MSLTIALTSFVGILAYAQLSTGQNTWLWYSLSFITILTLQLLISSVYQIAVYPLYLSPLRHLPHPKQAPFWTRLTKEAGVRTLTQWANEIPNDGLIRYLGFFNQERILVTRTQGAQEVLSAQAYHYIKHPWALEVMGHVVPQSILVAPPKKHKIDHRLLQPAFKAPYIRTLYPIFWNEGSKFLTAIEESISEHDTVDIGQLLHYVTLDIITLTGFGGSFNAVADRDSERIERIRNLLSAKRSHVLYRYWALFTPSWIFRRLPMQARYEIEAAVQEAHSVMLPIFQENRQMSSSKEADSQAQGAIIDTLLKSGNTFSDQFLLDQAVGFMIAGQETTATSVAFALYLLSEHPQVQTRLRAEIRANVISPDIDTAGGATDLRSLPYLTAVCLEVLRLYPPVPDVRRQTIAPNAVIESTPIPIGTNVVVTPWVIHHSEHIWGPTAANFNPDRWLVSGSNPLQVDSLGGSARPADMMTFTYGARACIGEHFAKGEMWTLVALLVGRFDWKFKGLGPKGDQEMRFTFGVTLAPRGGGMTMYSKRVEGW